MKLSASITPARRRIFSALLMILGATLIFLAPATWAGVVLLVMGALVELIGMALAHHNAQ